MSLYGVSVHSGYIHSTTDYSYRTPSINIIIKFFTAFGHEAWKIMSILCHRSAIANDACTSFIMEYVLWVLAISSIFNMILLHSYTRA